MRPNISRHNSTCSNSSILPHYDARQHSGASTNTSALFDDGAKQDKVFVTRAGIKIIGESYIRTDKDVILQGHTIPQLHTGFDRHTITDNHVIFDQNMRADVAVESNSGAWENHAELPYACSGTN